MSAAQMYRAAVEFLLDRDWRRVETGEGWWWHESLAGEFTIGEAVEAQLTDEAIDTRLDPVAS